MEDRYSRQIRFAPLGSAGQESLARARVLLVGVGALGTHIATALVRAGVGEIWLVDRDVVELDNLQRQVLFTESDAEHGRPKAIAAAEHLASVSSACAIHALTEDFQADTFERLERPDLILDGTDNFTTRYLLNDLALAHGIPWVYGGAVGSRGTAMAVLPGVTPCLRCMIPQAPPTGETGTCETVGVLSPAIAVVAAFQSAQAIKILAGRHDDVARGVLNVDVWNDHYALDLRDAGIAEDCAACREGVYPALTKQRPAPVKLCGRDAVQVAPTERTTVELDRIARGLDGIAEEIELTPHLLRFRIDRCRFSVFPGGRALLFGISDPERARILYDRYVGASS